MGSLKAIKKISLKMFAPKMEAVNISLIKPKIREVKIPKVLVKMDRNIGAHYPWAFLGIIFAIRRIITNLQGKSFQWQKKSYLLLNW